MNPPSFHPSAATHRCRRQNLVDFNDDHDITQSEGREGVQARSGTSPIRTVGLEKGCYCPGFVQGAVLDPTTS